MASTSRQTTRAFRQASRQMAAAPAAAQRRTFVSALNAARSGVAAQGPRVTVSAGFQQTRGVKTIDFAGTKETVYGMFWRLMIHC